MAESNSAWGSFRPDSMAVLWDGYSRLPAAGENALLDSWCEAHNLTIGALVRVGARLAEPTILALGHPDGIQFRDLTGERGVWAAHESQFRHRLKIVRAGIQPTDTVILCEGDADAARGSELWGQDVAVLVGARNFTEAHARQLEDYRLVAVMLDNDQAGNEGAAKVLEWLDNATRIDLPSGKDVCDLSADEIAAIEFPDPPLRSASWLIRQARKLGDLMRLGPPEVHFLPSSRLGERLFYRGHVFILAGHKKSGKSWAAIALAADQIEDGRAVVYVDNENGWEVFVERLLLLGVDPEKADEFLHYVPFPKPPPLDRLGAEIVAIHEEHPGALVLIDSLRSLIAYYGLDVNKQEDIEKITGPTMREVKSDARADARITVGFLDHSSRSTREGDEYVASGTQAKAASVDVMYQFLRTEKFSESKRGTVKIIVTDDRRGRLDEQRGYAVGGQGSGEPFYFEQIDLAELEDEPRTETDRLAVRCAHAVLDHGDTITRSEIAAALGVDPSGTLDRALARAIGKEWIERAERGRYRAGITEPPGVLVAF